MLFYTTKNIISISQDELPFPDITTSSVSNYGRLKTGAIEPGIIRPGVIEPGVIKPGVIEPGVK